MDTMFLLSSGKSTIISEFGSLENRDVYKHENNDATDFQFFPRQLIYAELNKNDQIEILRIKEMGASTLKIQRLKRMSYSAVCIASPKSYQEEVALGMRDGKIRLYDHVRSEQLHQFPADAGKTCVNHLDYNVSDEYLSAVYENGSINIFGIKTKVKVNTFKIDGVSTMTRFHPIKRAVLTIASHKGNVTIYDINVNRTTTNYTDVHTSPCRDLCMTKSRGDILISVGFDCLVNIFDMRLKRPVATFKQDHPLSAGAISDCGKYLCVGNLKGNISTYDIRNIKEERFLATRNVHEGQISRIAFFSTHETEAKDLSSQIQNTTHESTGTAEEDFHNSSSHTTNRRDSFNDFLNPHQQSDVSESIKRRNSYDFWNALGGNKTNGSVCQKANTNNSTNNSANSSPRKSFEEGLKTPRVFNPLEPVTARDLGKLKQIKEEYNSIENFNSESDKENNQTDQDEIVKRLPQQSLGRNSIQKLGDILRSGELFCPKNSMDRAHNEEQIIGNSRQSAMNRTHEEWEITEHLRQLNFDRNSTPKLADTSRSGELLSSKGDRERNHSDQEIIKSLPQLKAECNSTPKKADTLPSGELSTTPTITATGFAEIHARLDKLESELKFQMETNKWQTYTQMFSLWSKLNKNDEAMCDALEVLLQTDPFVNEFSRLKNENDMLKKELKKYTKK